MKQLTNKTMDNIKFVPNPGNRTMKIETGLDKMEYLFRNPFTTKMMKEAFSSDVILDDDNPPKNKRSIKNLRKHLNEGDLIRTSDNDVYEVLYLDKDEFQCRNIALIGSDLESIQRFKYTIGMIVFREHTRNVL